MSVVNFMDHKPEINPATLNRPGFAGAVCVSGDPHRFEGGPS